MADFFETFNNGVGQLNHTWGEFDTSVRGQVTISGNHSGIMERPWGDAAGHGYGVYSMTLSMEGNHVGPAALLWPGNDEWPGTELDMAEFINGKVYGTVHWNNNGRDAYESVFYDGIDSNDKHTYTLDWRPGEVIFSVDGEVYGSVDDNVGRDYDHGGVNVTIGANNTNPNSSITLYEVSYTAHDIW